MLPMSPKGVAYPFNEYLYIWYYIPKIQSICLRKQNYITILQVQAVLAFLYKLLWLLE